MDKPLTVRADERALVPDGSAAVFASDRPDVTGSSQAAFLADLVLYQGVETPLCVALQGPAGCGKSSLLHAAARAADALALAATQAGLATPFVGNVAVVPVTVGPEADPASAITAQVQDALRQAYPRLAAMHADPDPHKTAETARDRLDQLRHRLDAERRKLDDLTARQARLAETVLFDASGSQVDAYARSNRGRIERSLRGFGFGGDRLLAYRELVRDHADAGVSGWLPAFWSYRGQTRLLVVAAGFFILFWLLGLLIADQGPLIGSLRDGNERLAPFADWLAAHGAGLVAAREVAGLAGLAAIALNVIRGIRFLQPIARGARLLRGDLEARRRDLDGLVAHQAQRVEVLARDVEVASVRASEAESRLPPAATTQPGSVPGAEPSPRAAAAAFFAALGDALSAPRSDRGAIDSPGRLIVCLDGFERLPSREAAVALDTAHRLLARPGIVTLAALDRAHVAAGFGEADPAFASASLDRIVQVPLTVEADVDGGALTRALLAPPPQNAGSPPPQPDAARSALETPWLPQEAAVLQALAPFAGSTPRAIKRYVNLYRIARAHPAMGPADMTDRVALALGLAAQAQGLSPEGLVDTPAEESLDVMRRTAASALGQALAIGPQSAGLRVAERFSSF